MTTTFVNEQHLTVSFGQLKFNLDAQLATVVLALLIIGYVMLTSASMHLGEHRDLAVNLHYSIMQLIHIIVGFVLAIVVACLPLSFWKQATPWLFLFGILLLLLVFVPGIGTTVKGGIRWISIAGLRLQVSEPFKLFVILAMAGFISKNPDKIQGSIWNYIRTNRWEAIPKAIISPYGFLLMCCGLLMAQHNFGATAIVIVVTFGMFFLAGMRLGIFILGFSILSVIGTLLVVLSPYRLKRVTGFLDPFVDPSGNGYQIIQALISYVNGGWFGVGLGSGVQKMYFLPEAHTDFLFSVVGEELGFIGLLVIILLYVLLVWRIFKIAIMAEHNHHQFAAMLTYGVGLWLGFQSFINMGVNMGMLPPKGLTLPLMSYGGTSILITLVSLGLVFRVFHEATESNEHVQVGTHENKGKPQ
ncbi:MAG TPA: putative lipid II flippase FtsW [Crenotrichaceae bacterium]|nr:putative lipid II flippase FtsW [Crenotrichaceae bacterium]